MIHAGSSTASIRITVDTPRVIMKIRDLGKGMSMTIWGTKGQTTSNVSGNCMDGWISILEIGERQ